MKEASKTIFSLLTPEVSPGAEPRLESATSGAGSDDVGSLCEDANEKDPVDRATSSDADEEPSQRAIVREEKVEDTSDAIVVDGPEGDVDEDVVGQVFTDDMGGDDELDYDFEEEDVPDSPAITLVEEKGK